MHLGAYVSKKIKNFTPVRVITISFVVIIVLGTLFLMLPISSRSGGVRLIDALFISTSATCVTGLTPFDTFSQWSGFGQVVILLLIQIGGLGFVTFTTGFTLLWRGKIGLRDIQLAKEYTNGSVMDIQRLIRMILLFTFTCELAGALLLAFRFVPLYGGRGIWISVFLAISSYCNAGFDILGFEEPSSSLMHYSNDPLVLLPIALLIIVGGLGFIVVSEIYSCTAARIRRLGRTQHSLNLHTRIVLIMSGILLLMGTVLFLIFEYDNTLKGGFGEKLLGAFFQSASSRTAGYNSIAIGSQKSITQIVMILLMFIGASPASTGGGIKTTTFVVLMATVIGVFRGQSDTVILKRRIDKAIVYRALAIMTAAMFLVLCTTSVILLAEADNPSITTLSALFEAVSAFGTVGLSTGITPMLSTISKIAVIFTMFVGRVGPISLALTMAMHPGKKGAIMPEGRVIVG